MEITVRELIGRLEALPQDAVVKTVPGASVGYFERDDLQDIVEDPVQKQVLLITDYYMV